MNYLNRLFSNLLHDESGQDLIEYALVAALIGLGATASMRTLATSIGTALTGVGTRSPTPSNLPAELGLVQYGTCTNEIELKLLTESIPWED